MNAPTQSIYYAMLLILPLLGLLLVKLSLEGIRQYRLNRMWEVYGVLICLVNLYNVHCDRTDRQELKIDYFEINQPKLKSPFDSSPFYVDYLLDDPETLRTLVDFQGSNRAKETIEWLEEKDKKTATRYEKAS